MTDLFSRLGTAAVGSTRRVTADPFAAAAPVEAAATLRPESNLEPLRPLSAEPAPIASDRGRPDVAIPPGQPAQSAAPEPSPSALAHPTNVAPEPVAERRTESDSDALPSSPPEPLRTREPASLHLGPDPAVAERSDADPQPNSTAPASPIAQAVLRPAQPFLAQTEPAPANPPAIESRPTVRVHIGRLDVRATVDAKPVAPTTRRSDHPSDTSVSLSDYLAGRKVGS